MSTCRGASTVTTITTISGMGITTGTIRPTKRPVDSPRYQRLLGTLPAALAARAELAPLAHAFGLPLENGRARYLSTVACNLRLMHALDEILEAFQADGVSVQPLKGALLLETLYDGDLGARAMSDLDLLVPF